MLHGEFLYLVFVHFRWESDWTQIYGAQLQQQFYHVTSSSPTHPLSEEKVLFIERLCGVMMTQTCTVRSHYCVLWTTTISI